jgi:hypothetical protein
MSVWSRSARPLQSPRSGRCESVGKSQPVRIMMNPSEAVRERGQPAWGASQAKPSQEAKPAFAAAERVPVFGSVSPHQPQTTHALHDTRVPAMVAPDILLRRRGYPHQRQSLADGEHGASIILRRQVPVRGRPHTSGTHATEPHTDALSPTAPPPPPCTPLSCRRGITAKPPHHPIVPTIGYIGMDHES